MPGAGRFGQVQGPHKAGSTSFGSPAVHTSSPLSAVEMEASWPLIPQMACSAAPGQWKVWSHLEGFPLSAPLRLAHRSHFPAQFSHTLLSWDAHPGTGCSPEPVASPSDGLGFAPGVCVTTRSFVLRQQGHLPPPCPHTAEPLTTKRQASSKMSNRPQYTFLQRKYANGRQMKRCLTSLVVRERYKSQP